VATIEDLWLAPDGSRRPRYGTGRRYRVRWTLPGGVERSKSFPDGRKTEAGRFRVNIEADLLRGEYRDPRAGRITLREYVTRTWLPHQAYAAASTREAVERRLRLHILPQLGDKMITQITPTIVKGWLGRLDAAPATTRVLLGLLSSVLNAAIDDGLIVKNPVHARSVRAPRAERREIRPWSADQVAQARGGLPPRWQAMADCGAGMGLRIGEACGLAVEDVDFLRRVVHVRRQVQRIGGRTVFSRPKGGKERHVPLPDSVAVELAEHIRACPPAPVTLPWQVPAGKPVTAGLLFTMPGAKAIGPNDWNTAWHRALRAAGSRPARDAGFHQLRHHYASTLLAGGVDVRTLADALGHRDPGFTLRVYAHLMPDSADRIRAAIDRAATGPVPAQAAEKRS
jgi:integrase